MVLNLWDWIKSDYNFNRFQPINKIWFDSAPKGLKGEIYLDIFIEEKRKKFVIKKKEYKQCQNRKDIDIHEKQLKTAS